jgi:ParB family chromosome partitioning protein
MTEVTETTRHSSPEAKAPPRRRALGRGLDSLLPRAPAESVEPGSAAGAASAGEAAAPPGSAGVAGGVVADLQAAFTPPPMAAEGTPREIPLELIDRSPYQTRRNFDEAAMAELAASISATGVVQPVLVRPVAKGRFQLIAGERRWLASKQAGKATVPAILRSVSDEQAMEMTIVENLQRTDLNPMEQARAYERLSREFRMTQEQMAKRTGKDRSSVANFLRLLRLPEEVQARVESGELSFGHARALLALSDPEIILLTANKIEEMQMSVRQAERHVYGRLHPQEPSQAKESKKVEVDPNLREAELWLQRTLGLKVRIEDKSGRGRVIIEYAGLDDFDGFMTFLAKAQRG